jgi:septal ring factor EnvC (AmiA/AmiB activator)
MLAIFQKVFGERQAALDTIEDEYHSLLVRLASGEECDQDDVRRLTIDAGRTEAECSRDLQVMEQRLERIKDKQRRLELDAKVPSLQAKFDQLKHELDAITSKIQPQLSAIGLELYESVNAGGEVVRIDGWLNQTCLNRSLVEREKELGSHRFELASKRRPLYDDLVKTQQQISYTNALLERFENRKDGWVPREGARSLSEMRELQAKRDDAESTVAQLEQAIREIDDELVPVDAELADIGRQKLRP